MSDNIQCFVLYVYFCFTRCSWSVSQNEAKRSGDERNVPFKKKSIIGKSNDLENLEFISEKLFISHSTYYENHLLFYRCRQLKRWSLLHSACFFSNYIYIKVGKNPEVTRTTRFCDIEKSLNIQNIDSHFDINV